MAVLAAVDAVVEDDGNLEREAERNNSTSASSSTNSPPLASKTEVQNLYKSLRHMGLNHGPIFQNIISVDKDGVKDGVPRSSCAFLIADSASTMPYNFQQDHVLDPTTLDSILQAVYTALPSPSARSGAKEYPAMLPRSIGSLTIGARMPTKLATTLSVKSIVNKLTTQSFNSNAVVSLEGSTVPLMEIKGLFCQSLANSAAADIEGENNQLCFTSAWKPDISFLGAQDLLQLLSIPEAKRVGVPNRNGIINGNLGPTEPLVNGLNGVKSHRMLEDVIGVILEHLLHKNPRTQLLEIQGASSDLTAICLKALETIMPDAGTYSSLLKYTWTDQSADRIEAAQNRFAAYSNLLTFEEHVLEKKATSIYDLVMMPVEAAKDNISFLRDVVRPGGLVLAVNEQPASEGEIDAVPPCFGDNFETIELDVASAKLVLAVRNDDRSSISYLTDIVVVYAGHAPSQTWLESMSNSLSSASIDKKIAIECRSLAGMANDSTLARDKTVLVLDSHDQSVLVQPSKEQFETIRSVLVQAKNVLWVSGGGAVESERPDASLAVGLLRTLRCEYRYISLDLAGNSAISYSETSEVDGILKVLIATLGRSPCSSEEETIDLEYAVRNGRIRVLRVFEDKQNNSLLGDRTHLDEEIPFFSTDRNIRLGIGTPGLLDSLVFIDDDTAAASLAPDQVQIKPTAFGLNFRDVMVGMG